MFDFKGKVTQDITIDNVKVKSSQLTDASGVGKFFNFEG